jgi:3-hydroxyacyl-CoA dehydrogenase, NAD binding domain
LSDDKPIHRIAIIGTGVIGASWAALFLARGLDLIATDVAPDAEKSLKRFMEGAWPALQRLGLASDALQSRLTFTGDLPAAVREADFVQENGPERIDFKKKAVSAARRAVAGRRDHRIELIRPNDERDSLGLPRIRPGRCRSHRRGTGGLDGAIGRSYAARAVQADRSSVELNHSGRGWQTNSSNVWRESRP